MCAQHFASNDKTNFYLTTFRIPNLLEEPMDPCVPSGCAVHEWNHPRDRLPIGGAVRCDGNQGGFLQWRKTLDYDRVPSARRSACFGLEMVLNRSSTTYNYL